jgi:lysophospholipid acyltransferase (LPLAT)-like uncharacterized protein
MKDGFLYRISLRIIPFLYVFITSLLFLTCRIKTHGKEFRSQLDSQNVPIIASFWHYTIFYVFYYLRKDSAVVMVSASKDGEYINRVAQKLGFTTARGSRKKGGMQAIKSLIRNMRAGRNAGIVADGSQGPARVVQAGSIVLASRTAAPILPMVWSCDRYKRFGSWDGTALPLPFSKIDFFYGEPVIVPPKIKSEEFEQYRLLLEERLNDLYTKAWALQNKTEH